MENEKQTVSQDTPLWIIEGIQRGELEVIQIEEYVKDQTVNTEVFINGGAVLVTGIRERHLAHTYVVPECFLLMGELEETLMSGRYPQFYRFTDIKERSGGKPVWPSLGYKVNTKDMNEAMRYMVRCDSVNDSLNVDEMSVALKSIFNYNLAIGVGDFLIPGIDLENEKALAEYGIDIKKHRRSMIISWMMGKMMLVVVKQAVFGCKEAMDAVAKNLNMVVKHLGKMINEVEQIPEGRKLLEKIMQEQRNQRE